jgi:hypothetical protein
MWNIGLRCATLTVVGAGSLTLGIVGMLHDQGADPNGLVASDEQRRVEDVVALYLANGVEQPAPIAVISLDALAYLGRIGRA